MGFSPLCMPVDMKGRHQNVNVQILMNSCHMQSYDHIKESTEVQSFQAVPNVLSITPSYFLPLLVALLQASCFLVHNCIICKLLLICGCFAEREGKCIAYYLHVVVKQSFFSPLKNAHRQLVLTHFYCVLYCLYLYEVVHLHARCDYANLYSSPFSLLTFSLRQDMHLVFFC